MFHILEFTGKTLLATPLMMLLILCFALALGLVIFLPLALIGVNVAPYVALAKIITGWALIIGGPIAAVVAVPFVE